MCCHGAARIVLTAPRSYEAVALHRGACEKRLYDGKLATSSMITLFLSQGDFCATAFAVLAVHAAVLASRTLTEVHVSQCAPASL
jgi:hypothetical protein